MKKRKSILIVIMSVCLGALGLTKVLSDAPQEAPAAVGVGSDTGRNSATSTTEKSAAGASTLKITRAPFPTGLDQPSNGLPVRNIFVMPRMEPAIEVDKKEAVGAANLDLPAAPPALESEAAAFKGEHHLTAVMNSASSALALVDDQWVEIGDQVGDCTLVRIEADSAVFHCPTGETTLAISVE